MQYPRQAPANAMQRIHQDVASWLIFEVNAPAALRDRPNHHAHLMDRILVIAAPLFAMAGPTVDSSIALAIGRTLTLATALAYREHSLVAQRDQQGGFGLAEL